MFCNELWGRDVWDIIGFMVSKVSSLLMSYGLHDSCDIVIYNKDMIALCSTSGTELLEPLEFMKR